MKQTNEEALETLGAQICFWKDGFMVCNYVIRKGKVVASKAGKYLRWPCPRPKSKGKNEVELIQTENEPRSKQARLSE